MALKALLLRRKIDEKKNALASLRQKSEEMEKREAEFAAAIAEVTEETSEEDRAALETQVNEFDAELTEHRDTVTALENEIAEMERQLSEEETRQTTVPPVVNTPVETDIRNGGNTMIMNTRSRVFRNMNTQEREAFCARQDVRDFLANVRTSIQQKRAIENVGLTIPEVVVGLIRGNIEENSKLLKHVNLISLNGDGRQLVMGAIPEAIWTECCAQLNELTLAFNDLELNCYMVGGYYAICNANLEDSDLNLSAEIIAAIGKAIGTGVDKAILYGRNSNETMKMPEGIVSRLAQTAKPSGYPTTARPWTDLHTSNVVNIAANVTGIAFFQELAKKAAVLKADYARSEKTWCMNEATYAIVVSNGMSVDAGGAIVSGVNKTMPVLGGDIEILSWMPDSVIVVGYFDLYTLAERAGAKFATSEHVRFLQNQTVFKGIARYDGAPVIAEAFLAIGIAGANPTAGAVTFAVDEANTVSGILFPTAASVKAGSKVKLQAVLTPFGVEADVTFTSGTPANATVAEDGTVTGVKAGTSDITVTAAGLSAKCTVTVTA